MTSHSWTSHSKNFVLCRGGPLSSAAGRQSALFRCVAGKWHTAHFVGRGGRGARQLCGHASYIDGRGAQTRTSPSSTTPNDRFISSSQNLDLRALGAVGTSLASRGEALKIVPLLYVKPLLFLIVRNMYSMGRERKVGGLVRYDQ